MVLSVPLLQQLLFSSSSAMSPYPPAKPVSAWQILSLCQPRVWSCAQGQMVGLHPVLHLMGKCCLLSVMGEWFRAPLITEQHLDFLKKSTTLKQFGSRFTPLFTAWRKYAKPNAADRLSRSLTGIHRAKFQSSSLPNNHSIQSLYFRAPEANFQARPGNLSSIKYSGKKILRNEKK